MSTREVESSASAPLPGPVVHGALRGAVGFGLGALAFALVVVLSVLRGYGRVLPVVLVGIIGGGALGWEGKAEWRSALLTAAGFGLACIPAWQPLVLLPFALAKIHSPLDLLLGGAVLALPLALVGGLGAPFLATRPGLHSLARLMALSGAGVLTFGAGGALGGILAGLLAAPFGLFGAAIGLVMSFALGGALLGARVEWLERRSLDSETAAPGRAPTARVSGIAVVGMVLGVAGCATAVLYPLRLGLPEIPILTYWLSRMSGVWQASLLLVCLGLPPLVLGLIGAEGIRRARPALRGILWARIAILSGTLVVLSTTRFLWPPIANGMERNHAVARLARARGHESNWDYGDIVHQSHIALGRVALREGDVAEAKRQLLEAGRTRGSPTLNAYGPDMTLARQLLAKDERAVVLDYLELCRRLWKGSGACQLDGWSQAIRDGRTPDFGPNASSP